MKNETKQFVLDSEGIEDAVVADALALAKGQANNVSMQTQSKLQQARELAVARLAEREQAAASFKSGNGLVLSGFMPYLRQPKALLFAALLVLLTWMSVQQYGHQQQLENSDALLLAADLPPEAFADKEFNQWVEFAGR